MKKVYVVTDGNYSNYRIVGICSTLSNAKILKELRNAQNDIETVTLDDLPEAPSGMRVYCTVMNENGDVKSCNLEDCEVMTYNWTWAPYGDDKNVFFHDWARSEEHAIKIANERRIQLIANNQWCTNFEDWEKEK